jgi:predicted choloylglycine hydrolase
MSEGIDLRRLPEWVKSLGLPNEASAAIDRWWQPAWERIADALPLLPVHPARTPEETPDAEPADPGAEWVAFRAVTEDRPGSVWQASFRELWPAYRCWYLRDGDAARPDLAECRDALRTHMPELVETWEKLVDLADGDDLAARCLSLWRPPAFITGCSQAAWTRTGDEPVLVRNYDYPASRLEGIIASTAWTGRRVIGMTDCLSGLLDGMNDAGLAVSLTFGGRRAEGPGFGVPLVVRYILETCETAAEARRVLERVPVHAPQNITVLDRSGTWLTAYVGPDRTPEFSRYPATTNHQGRVEWPEYARAIRSVERERCLLDRVVDTDLTRDEFVDGFLEAPLHNTGYAHGFGTVYTAAYFPAEGRAEYRWPGFTWHQSLEDFREGTHTETFIDGRRAA